MMEKVYHVSGKFLLLAESTYSGHSGDVSTTYVILLTSGYRTIQLVNFRLQGIYFSL